MLTKMKHPLTGEEFTFETTGRYGDDDDAERAKEAVREALKSGASYEDAQSAGDIAYTQGWAAPSDSDGIVLEWEGKEEEMNDLLFKLPKICVAILCPYNGEDLLYAWSVLHETTQFHWPLTYNGNDSPRFHSPPSVDLRGVAAKVLDDIRDNNAYPKDCAYSIVVARVFGDPRAWFASWGVHHSACMAPPSRPEDGARFAEERRVDLEFAAGAA